MAKTKSEKSPVEILEAAVRKAIDECSVLKGLSELQHFQTVDEALDLIQEGVNMRLQELEPDEFGM